MYFDDSVQEKMSYNTSVHWLEVLLKTDRYRCNLLFGGHSLFVFYVSCIKNFFVLNLYLYSMNHSMSTVLLCLHQKHGAQNTNVTYILRILCLFLCSSILDKHDMYPLGKWKTVVFQAIIGIMFTSVDDRRARPSLEPGVELTTQCSMVQCITRIPPGLAVFIRTNTVYV